MGISSDNSAQIIDSKSVNAETSQSWLYFLPLFASLSIIASIDLVAIILQGFFIFADSIFTFNLDSDGPESLSIILFFNAILDIFALAFLFALIFKKVLPFNDQEKNTHFGFNLTLKFYAMVTAIIISIGLISNYIWENLFPESPNISPYEDLFINEDNFSELNLILLIIMVALLAPIFEELLFRRFLIPLFEGTGVFSTGMAIIASATMFGLIHSEANLISGSIRFAGNHFITSSIIGIALGIVYVLTRDIRYPILFHGINNGYAVFGMLVLYYEPLPENPENATLGPLSLVFGLIALCIVVAGVILLIISFFKYKQYWYPVKEQFNAPSDFTTGKKVLIIISLLIIEGFFFVLIPIFDNGITDFFFPDDDLFSLIIGFFSSLLIVIIFFLIVFRFKATLFRIGEVKNQKLVPPQEPRQFIPYQAYSSPEGFPQYQKSNVPYMQTSLRYCGSCGHELPMINGNPVHYCPNCGSKTTLELK
ncbi:MAG: CPBP family glutamic-type intramembrane protease [Candidatus Hodarchaeales archaeon]|jgi:membrane protease YdiL (CAAX protease family)